MIHLPTCWEPENEFIIPFSGFNEVALESCAVSSLSPKGLDANLKDPKTVSVDLHEIQYQPEKDNDNTDVTDIHP